MTHHHHHHSAMQSDKKILAAFLLNLGFSLFEAIGGFLCGSVAILSDAVHDLGDAAAIGLSYFFEKKSRRAPDDVYTYGRYSLFGSLFTTLILIAGSVFVLLQAASRLVSPTELREEGMLLMALFGPVVNLAAACFTRGGDSLNQRSVNLHMLEDVAGWAAVLFGALVIRFTGWTLIDPLLSAATALFLLIQAIRNLSCTLEPLSERAPKGLCAEQIREALLAVEGGLGRAPHPPLGTRRGAELCYDAPGMHRRSRSGQDALARRTQRVGRPARDP